MTSLEDFLDIDWGGEIRHATDLDRALRAIRDRRRRIVEVETRAQAEIDRIRNWVQAETDKPAREAALIEAAVEEWALAQREQGGAKSLSSPYGVVKTRQGQASWDVADPAALLAWLNEHRPQLVRVTPAVESVDKAALKRVFAVEGGKAFDTEHGVEVPGVKVTDAVVTASVEVDLGLDADREDDR
jgi:phage host-nuclease inhibitor protein Gam